MNPCNPLRVECPRCHVARTYAPCEVRLHEVFTDRFYPGDYDTYRAVDCPCGAVIRLQRVEPSTGGASLPRLAAQTAAVVAFSTVALLAACAAFTGFMLAPLFGARMPS